MTAGQAVRGLIVACLLAFAPAAALAQTFPALTGRVVDQANILSPAVEADMTAKLAALEAKNGTQLVVATVPSLQDHPIEDYGNRLIRHWALGQEKEDNGAIFLVAPTERRVRIEVGYGLEPVLTDALATVILHERVLPRFREGDMEAGVVSGVHAVVEQLGLDPAVAQQRATEAVQQQASAEFNPIPAIIIFFIVVWILSSMLGALGLRGRRRRRRGGGGLLPVILWSLAESAASSSRRGGGWGGGGGFGGGGFGGGGFSGGGGSGGGGGASGGW
ncbi:MAG TPA: TPM domain-containing protein [Caulobacteraceae bacterium]|jgi:uncharacterized protein